MVEYYCLHCDQLNSSDTNYELFQCSKLRKENSDRITNMKFTLDRL